MNTNSIHAKHLQDDMYHKSEMREFSRAQLKIARWTALTMVAAAVITGLLIGVFPVAAKLLGWLP